MANKRNSNFFRNKQVSPVVQQQLLEKAIETKLIETRANSIEFAIIAMKVMTDMILHDKFEGFDDGETIKKFNEELSNVADSILKDYVTIPDMVKALHEECGYTLTSDELAKFDTALAPYL